MIARVCRRYITELNGLIISQLDRRVLDLIIAIFRRMKNVPAGMIDAVEASDKFKSLVPNKITVTIIDSQLSIALSRANYDLSMALKICLGAVEVEGSNHLNFTHELSTTPKAMKAMMTKLAADFKWELELI